MPTVDPEVPTARIVQSTPRIVHKRRRMTGDRVEKDDLAGGTKCGKRRKSYVEPVISAEGQRTVVKLPLGKPERMTALAASLPLVRAEVNGCDQTVQQVTGPA